MAEGMEEVKTRPKMRLLVVPWKCLEKNFQA